MNGADAPARLPPLPLDAWEESKITLHLWLQIVGKVRLALHPKLNHWWHAPLYLSARGLTTGALPAGDETIEVAFDFVEPGLELRSSAGGLERFALRDGLSVAAFYRALFAALDRLDVEVAIEARPYDPERVGSGAPFAEDETHAHYDADAVRRFWRILLWTDRVFRRFRGRFVGKSTPVHLFWHSFDLAYTRFSGREAPLGEGSVVDREAYSHEVISFGFWAGDAQVRAPAFYAYAYPEPAGLREEPLQPDAAVWTGEASAMALLLYDDLRALPDPEAALLEFLESAYRAGARRADWAAASLRRDAAAD